MNDSPNIWPDLSYNAINDRIILGSQSRTIDDLKKICSMSVSHILNVCETDDLLLLNPPTIESLSNLGFSDYLFNPTSDDGKAKSVDWFQASLRFILPILAKTGWVFYIHCVDGIDQSAVSVYIILRALGFSSIKSEAIIKVARPEALWRYKLDADNNVIKGW